MAYHHMIAPATREITMTPIAPISTTSNFMVKTPSKRKDYGIKASNALRDPRHFLDGCLEPCAGCG